MEAWKVVFQNYQRRRQKGGKRRVIKGRKKRRGKIRIREARRISNKIDEKEGKFEDTQDIREKLFQKSMQE